jgi:hypothetical protein
LIGGSSDNYLHILGRIAVIRPLRPVANITPDCFHFCGLCSLEIKLLSSNGITCFSILYHFTHHRCFPSSFPAENRYNSLIIEIMVNDASNLLCVHMTLRTQKMNVIESCQFISRAIYCLHHRNPARLDSDPAPESSHIDCIPSHQRIRSDHCFSLAPWRYPGWRGH